MLPAYKNKQIIIVSPLVTPNVGSVVIAVMGGREVLKRITAIHKNHMYELLGDNQNESTDSRQYGLVPRTSILSVVVWPKK
jgi:type IV secretory pathway protease TraF